MGLNDPDPVRSAGTARELLTAGMGDIGISLRAEEALRIRGVDPSNAAHDLTQEYIDTWTGLGYESIITRQVGDETLCAGCRDALRINVWLCGEPGMPAVPFDELNSNA